VTASLDLLTVLSPSTPPSHPFQDLVLLFILYFCKINFLASTCRWEYVVCLSMPDLFHLTYCPSFIHAAANVRISFFLWGDNIPLYTYIHTYIYIYIYMYIYIYKIFFIHSSTNGYLGWFYTLALVNIVAINMEVQRFFWHWFHFFWLYSSSGISGSSESPMLRFLRKLHTVL
jgi:hypothetical protein